LFVQSELEAAPPWTTGGVFREQDCECERTVWCSSRPNYHRAIPLGGMGKTRSWTSDHFHYGSSSFLGKPVGIVSSNSPGTARVRFFVHTPSKEALLELSLPGISARSWWQPETLSECVSADFAVDDKGQLTKESLQKCCLQQFSDAFASLRRKAELRNDMAGCPGMRCEAGRCVRCVDCV